MESFQILIVDDEELARDALRMILEGAGYRVVEAAGGREALEICRREPPDLIVTDLVMPDVQGADLVREFGEVAPGSGIIVISGGGHPRSPDLRRLARDLGVDATFTKPIDRDELLATVASLLSST